MTLYLLLSSSNTRAGQVVKLDTARFRSSAVSGRRPETRPRLSLKAQPDHPGPRTRSRGLSPKFRKRRRPVGGGGRRSGGTEADFGVMDDREGAAAPRHGKVRPTVNASGAPGRKSRSRRRRRTQGAAGAGRSRTGSRSYYRLFFRPRASRYKGVATTTITTPFAGERRRRRRGSRPATTEASRIPIPGDVGPPQTAGHINRGGAGRKIKTQKARTPRHARP